MQGQDAPVEVVGQIKWFDPAKGFGFIVGPPGGADILLHANVLRNFGQSSVTEGAQVRVLAIPTGRGQQAVEVLEILPPPGGSAAQIADLADRDIATLDALPFLPARVKWFDKAKGFGFANVFGQPGDIFLHVEVLRHGGFADLTVGEAIAVKVVEGRRGPMAAQVSSWDRSATDAQGAADHSPMPGGDIFPGTDDCAAAGGGCLGPGPGAGSLVAARL